jgi:uncharacterized protein YcbX
VITISGLFVYPVKSCRGISLDEVEIGTRGFLHDREFLVVDETDRFVTQRTLAELARVEISLGETGFKMCAPNVGELHLPYAQQTDGRTRTVTIFNDTVVADDAGDEAAEWFSSALAQRCRLVRIGAAYSRTVRPDNIRDEHRSAVVAPAVSFTDAFPTLITSEESLANLNTRLPSPVPMNRFRPNIVVRGSGAYDENAWSTVRAGDMLFRAATACLRCTITTIDQELARQTGAEPLRTLATYRRSPAREGVMFGEYLIHDRRRGPL